MTSRDLGILMRRLIWYWIPKCTPADTSINCPDWVYNWQQSQCYVEMITFNCIPILNTMNCFKGKIITIWIHFWSLPCNTTRMLIPVPFFLYKRSWDLVTTVLAQVLLSMILHGILFINFDDGIQNCWRPSEILAFHHNKLIHNEPILWAVMTIKP